MEEVEFPVGQTLIGVMVKNDEVFANNELALDEIQLVFDDIVLTLRPVADTDEIEITQKAKTNKFITNTPNWCKPLAGKVLQTAWLCENAQGYFDQVIFAFEHFHPNIAFVAEGSVLKVFRFEQIYQEANKQALVGGVGSKKP